MLAVARDASACRDPYRVRESRVPVVQDVKRLEHRLPTRLVREGPFATNRNAPPMWAWTRGQQRLHHLGQYFCRRL